MYNTFRTIVFITSSFIIFLLYPLIQQLTYLLLAYSFEKIMTPTILVEVYKAVVFILSLLTFAILQIIIRTLLNHKYSKNNSIMTYPITSFSFGDKIIYYIIPFLIYILPLFQRSYLNEVILLRIILFITTIALFRIILGFSKKRTHVYFLKEGIIIKGLDLRLDLPLTTAFFNSSGYYPYTKLQHYLFRDTALELKLPAESGKLVMSISEEEKQELQQFLVMMNIPEGSTQDDI